MNADKKILVTGAAGFIGAALSKKLLEMGFTVAGVDSLNDYYDVHLKYTRLDLLKPYQNFTFFKIDLADSQAVGKLFSDARFDIVIHLAAQAGVRYSITNPEAYVQSNIVGFFNILEACRNHPVTHLVYASSSSVYGVNQKVPYSVEDKTDMPVSLYAATKKADEAMTYSYSKLYQIPATGLRFFTVYGPLGRPDMAYFSFTDKMVRGEKIQLYNYGEMKRDFTYIRDVVDGIVKVMAKPPAPDENGAPHKLYNIGNSKPETLTNFVKMLENCLMAAGVIKQPAEKEYLPIQPGDVLQTYADVSELERDFGFRPKTDLKTGLSEFAKWYKEFYKI